MSKIRKEKDFLLIIDPIAGGTMLSGVIVRGFNLKKSCRQSAKYCVIFQIFTLWTLASFMIPGCDQVNLAGVVKPYSNR